MGSRKDLIKRHLGITEYPWSSDDELEGATHAAEESSLRRQAAEIRPTIPDAPGTSGDPPQPMPPMVPQQQQHQPSQLQQQQQHQQQQHQQQQHQQQHHQQQLEHHHHHHQQQERFDHQLQQLQLQQQQLHQEVNATWHQARADLCRSIANSAPRLPSHRISAHSSRVHANEMPMSYVSRVNHVPAQELSEHSAERSEADIQRMIAFKRLTRNLGSLRHRAHIAGVIPVTRVNPGVIVPSEANSSYRSSRHIPIRRYLRIGPYGPLPLRSGYLSSSSPGDRPTPMGTLQNRSGQSEHDELIDEDHPIPPQPQPPIPGPSTEDEVNNNPIPLPATADLVVSDDGNVVLDVQLQQELDAEASANHSSANATLQDEIDAMAFDNREVTAPVSTVDEEEEEEEVTDRRAESSTEDAAGPSGAHFSMALHGSGSDRNMPSTSSETVDADPQQPPRHSVKRRRDDVDIRLDAFSIQEFNQNLLRLLECPVCLDWMEPPMSQCQRGHLVCGRCRARLAACPVCRTSFSSVRNRAMEGVAEMLRYPCRHGCGREVRLRRRAAHESSCTSRKYQCPAPVCVGAVPMPREMLPHHFQSSLEEDNASHRDVEQPAPPSQDNGPSQPPEVERPYLGALHIQAMNVANESSLPEEILLESQSDELPSQPSTSQDYSGQVQQPASPGMPYLEALRGHMLNVANQASVEEENASQPDIEPPNPPTQNEEPIERHEVDRPYLGALRIQAMNAANESPLHEESLLESYSEEQPPQPSTSQNGGGQLQQHVSAGMPYLEALHGHMLHIANESPRLTLDFPQHGRRHILPRNVGLPFEFQSWDSTRQYLESLGIRALNQVNENLHLTMMRIGRHHKFSMKVNAEQHDNWIIFAMEEYFHLRINVDIRTWGVIAYASYIGPKCEANNYTYEVTVEGRANQRKLSYVRTTHSDLESSSLNVCRQDCFHLTLDQALHFIRFKNHTEKYIDFNVVISRVEQPVAAEAAREESHS